MRRSKLAIGFIFILLLIVSDFAVGLDNIEYRGFFAPGPRLISPLCEEFNLTGKDFLEFKWQTCSGADSYEFRLFKGYNMFADDLVVKEKVFSDSICIEATKFEDRQVYTWSLRQIFSNGIKSDQSFHSFKVIKK